jgi:hypothetical protein
LIHYCSYFDHNYLTRAVALHGSLIRHSPPFVLWALCLDDEAFAAVTALGFDTLKPIRLADLEEADPGLLAAKQNRTKVEYYFTLSPVLPLYLLDHVTGIDSVTYLDSDLLFYSNPQQVFDELGAGSVAIVPHRYPPALQELAVYGKYNVAWITFRNDAAGRAVLGRWHRQCLEWCYDRVEDGKFADQGYLDEWPDLPGVRVIQNVGVDLAPWNFMQYRIDLEAKPPTVDGSPLVFYHFQSFKPVGPGLWDTCLDPYGKMDGHLRSWLYGGYLRELRSAAGLIRSRFPSYSRSDSLRRSRPKWRTILRRIRRGQVLVSPRSVRL